MKNTPMDCFVIFDTLNGLFGKDIGLISLNVENISQNEENEDIFLNLQYPLGELISKETFDKFLEQITDKYTNISGLLDAVDDDYDDISLNYVINHDFKKEFRQKYFRELSLEEYLKLYPLVKDSDSIYLDIELPDFLENQQHSLHLDIEVVRNGTSTNGLIVYREEEDNFYIYNKDEKCVSFFIINNTEENLKNTKLKLYDFINRK